MSFAVKLGDGARYFLGEYGQPEGKKCWRSSALSLASR